MSELQRVELAPAWVLHRYPYRETSLIVEALTRDQGRIGLVARGARGRRRRGVALMPFAALALSFRRRGELATLTGAEAAGPTYAFTGKAFLAACYLNELVLRLTARDDPAPEVYRLYSDALVRLEAETGPAVRRFEGRLIRALGFALPLTEDANGASLTAEERYRFDPAHGLEPAPAGEGHAGAMLAAIAAERFEDPLVLMAAGRIFRDVIAWHLDGRRLKSLEVARAFGRRAD
ncbi:MAG: DNA repair protein RecO [Gammaproteobacteria bacterium]